MNIFNLFQKEHTVEEIHQEFDSAEQRCIDSCETILKSLNITTESSIELKADSLKSLGFNNSYTVKQSESIKEKNNKVKNVKDLTLSQVNTIKELKFNYPFEKFITIDELDRICKKYNLMYASVSYYIKDVPQKNLDEMKKAKKLTTKDTCEKTEILLELNDLAVKMLAHMGRNNIFTESQKKQFLFEQYKREVPEWLLNERWFSIGGNIYCEKHGLSVEDYPIYTKSKIVNKNGLFIAAPKSHFDLTNLSKESEFGFFEVKTVEVKDPVVFEFCKNNIVRIISKWGDENEQNYSEVNNETLN